MKDHGKTQAHWYLLLAILFSLEYEVRKIHAIQDISYKLPKLISEQKQTILSPPSHRLMPPDSTSTPEPDSEVRISWSPSRHMGKGTR